MIPTIENPMHDHYYVFRHFAINVCNSHFPIHYPGSIRMIVGMHTHIERPLIQSLSPPATIPAIQPAR